MLPFRLFTTMSTSASQTTKLRQSLTGLQTLYSNVRVNDSLAGHSSPFVDMPMPDTSELPEPIEAARLVDNILTYVLLLPMA